MAGGMSCFILALCIFSVHSFSIIRLKTNDLKGGYEEFVADASQSHSQQLLRVRRKVTDNDIPVEDYANFDHDLSDAEVDSLFNASAEARSARDEDLKQQVQMQKERVKDLLQTDTSDDLSDLDDQKLVDLAKTDEAREEESHLEGPNTNSSLKVQVDQLVQKEAGNLTRKQLAKALDKMESQLNEERAPRAIESLDKQDDLLEQVPVVTIPPHSDSIHNFVLENVHDRITLDKNGQWVLQVKDRK